MYLSFGGLKFHQIPTPATTIVSEFLSVRAKTPLSKDVQDSSISRQFSI